MDETDLSSGRSRPSVRSVSSFPNRPSLNDLQQKKAALRKGKAVFPARKKGGGCSFNIANLERRAVSACLCFITETFTACQSGARSSLLAAGRSKTLLTERSPGKYSDTRRFLHIRDSEGLFFSPPTQFARIPVWQKKKRQSNDGCLNWPPEASQRRSVPRPTGIQHSRAFIPMHLQKSSSFATFSAYADGFRIMWPPKSM